MLCQISGVFRTPDGEVVADSPVEFTRIFSKVHGYVAETGPTVVVPNKVSLTTDENGVGEIGLYPGAYQASLLGSDGRKYLFKVNVPEEATIELTALLVQAPEYEHGLQPDTVMNYVAQAAAARDEAQAIVTGLDGTVEAVQEDVDAVAANLVLVNQAKDDAQTAATAAGVSETNAAGAASTATTQAGIATTQAGIATTAASEAEASATAAAESEANVLAVEGNLISVGSILFFAAEVAPLGWLICDGTPVTTMYAALRTFLIDAGSPYGTSGSDPLLPDLRGEFIRGWDGIRGVDAGRVFGSSQGELVGPHSHVVNLYHNTGGSATSPAGHQIAFAQVGGSGQGDEQLVAITSETNAGAETRPRNVALLPCIKAFGSVNITGAADLAELLTAIASNAEAVAGLNNTKIMTPLRTKEAIAAQVKQGRRLLAKRTISASAFINFTEFNNDLYFWYDWEFIVPVRPANDATKFQMLLSADGGTTFANGASDYYQSGEYMENSSGPANDGGLLSAIMVSSNGRLVGNAAGELGVRGMIRMRGAHSATSYTEVEADNITLETSTGTYLKHTFSAKRVVAAITNAVRFIQSAGNLASGEIWMYGHTE